MYVYYTCMLIFTYTYMSIRKKWVPTYVGVQNESVCTNGTPLYTHGARVWRKSLLQKCVLVCVTRLYMHGAGVWRKSVCSCDCIRMAQECGAPVCARATRLYTHGARVWRESVGFSCAIRILSCKDSVG